jgi:hypothetical protein
MAQARQYDLFGEQEAKEAGREAKERVAAEWRARFERAEWVPTWTTSADGTPAPPKLGWVCPACKVVEPNEFLLGNNHGYHLHWPGHVPYRAEFGATCSRLELLAAHALYDKRRAMIRHLIAVGMDDEQIERRREGRPAGRASRPGGDRQGSSRVGLPLRVLRRPVRLPVLRVIPADRTMRRTRGSRRDAVLMTEGDKG